MRARADAVPVKSSTGADRPDMRAGMHTPIAHTGAGAHDMPDMAAGANAVAVHVRASTDTADMRAGTHPMAADMRADTNPQDMNAQFNRRGGRRQQRQGADGGGKNFHGRCPVGDTVANGQHTATFHHE